MPEHTIPALTPSGTVADVIENAVKGVAAGCKRVGVSVENIDFELSAVAQTGADGKMDLKVIKAGDQNMHETVHKVRFKVQFPEQLGGD